MLAKQTERKRGPQPKPPEELRSASVRVRLTAEEKQVLDRAEALLKLPGGASELIRSRILPYGRSVVSKVGH